jgi:uncharacterized protein (DUF1330 family)
MKTTRQAISIAGLVVTMIAAAYMVARMDAQGSGAVGDFTKAAQAEVRDAQGQVLLRGTFVLEEEEDDDTERKAVLQPAGADAAAAGEAEVEYAVASAASQEVEFSVRGLQPGTAVTFVIDGVAVATATTDDRGRASVELDVKMPSAAR